MTAFKDVTGISGVKALQLDGTACWMGTSANMAALSESGNPIVLSVANWASASATGTVMTMGAANADSGSLQIAWLLRALAKLGLITIKYDGTNSVDPSSAT